MQMMTRNVLLEADLEEDDDEDGDIGELRGCLVLTPKPERARGEVWGATR
jgi:hypothetical protein